MATFKDLAGNQKPVTAYPKKIKFGPVELEGYMLENGEFRQSISSTEKALGAENSKIVRRMFQPRYANSQPVFGHTTNQLQQLASQPYDPKKGQSETPVVLAVRPLVNNVAGNTLYTINLPMVVEIWKQIAMSNSKHSLAALELLGLSAVHSLERTYQEAFGVEDTRNTGQRLIDWSIRMDAGKHFPLFGNQFNKHFARVTGRTVGYDYYSAICMADLVYHRLPEPVYEKLKEINKIDPDTGRREHTYAQLMTEEMLAQMREVVAVVTNALANTASKADDPKDYRRLLQRLDRTLPRYKTRASYQRGVYPTALREWHESRKKTSETND